MNKATKAKKAAAATVTTMVRDGVTYLHDPATVGHGRHSAACWTPAVPFVDVSTISEYGLTQKLSNAVRVF